MLAEASFSIKKKKKKDKNPTIYIKFRHFHLLRSTIKEGAFQVAFVVKNSLANAGDMGDTSLIDPLEKGTATHTSILAWRIPWTEKSARLRSIRSQRVRHN